jgi:hypothetical protein
MPMIESTKFELIAATPANNIDPSIAISAVRAGYKAALDLTYADFQYRGTRDALRQFVDSGDRPSWHQNCSKTRGGDVQHLDRLAEGFIPRLPGFRHGRYDSQPTPAGLIARKVRGRCQIRGAGSDIVASGDE